MAAHSDRKKLVLDTHATKSKEQQFYIWCEVFDISAMIGQNLMLKSKWWVLIRACKWVPNVKFHFDVCVDCRQCLTDTWKSNSTLGTFSNKCPKGKNLAVLPETRIGLISAVGGKPLPLTLKLLVETKDNQQKRTKVGRIRLELFWAFFERSNGRKKSNSDLLFVPRFQEIFSGNWRFPLEVGRA